MNTTTKVLGGALAAAMLISSQGHAAIRPGTYAINLGYCDTFTLTYQSDGVTVIGYHDYSGCGGGQYAANGWQVKYSLAVYPQTGGSFSVNDTGGWAYDGWQATTWNFDLKHKVWAVYDSDGIGSWFENNAGSLTYTYTPPGAPAASVAGVAGHGHSNSRSSK
jgi:hypothetical protein